MKSALLLIPLLLLAGCASQNGPGIVDTGPGGSANFQRCASQCQGGNAGSGAFCMDGCRVQEAEDTKDTSWCDRLDNRANVPSCYGTVAKSAGDIRICDRLADDTDHNYCVSVFGGPGTS
jgi:hypothetical protein